VLMQLYKDLVETETTRLGFFKGLTYAISVVGVITLAISAVYFMHVTKDRNAPAHADELEPA